MIQKKWVFILSLLICLKQTITFNLIPSLTGLRDQKEEVKARYSINLLIPFSFQITEYRNDSYYNHHCYDSY